MPLSQQTAVNSYPLQNYNMEIIALAKMFKQWQNANLVQIQTFLCCYVLALLNSITQSPNTKHAKLLPLSLMQLSCHSGQCYNCKGVKLDPVNHVFSLVK